MAQDKISYEQFLETVEASNQPFVQGLHDYMLANGCVATYEEKKSGLLASYKIGKPKKALLNIIFRKKGMLVRIYGEKTGGYSGFLNALPEEMVQSIDKAGECKRLVHGTCSPKCSGYDITINGKHFQKCRYSAFEFLVTDESKPYIQSFIENEVKQRLL